MCSLAHASTALGLKHRIAQFGLTFMIYMSGLGLIYLAI
jgi:hypothetical protein